MNEDELDLSWASDQVARSKVPVPVGNAIMALLKTWGDLSFPSEEFQAQTLELFSSLAKSEAVVDEGEGTWAPVVLGYAIQVGDTVRVQKDAFLGAAGRVHNGRVGRVVAKRSGDIIIRSTDDRLPVLDGAHYPPTLLELKTS